MVIAPTKLLFAPTALLTVHVRRPEAQHTIARREERAVASHRDGVEPHGTRAHDLERCGILFLNIVELAPGS